MTARGKTKARTRRVTAPAQIIVPAILAELVRQGHTPYWLARQLGLQPNAIYAMLKRGFSVARVDAMLAALGLTVVPATRRR